MAIYTIKHGTHYREKYRLVNPIHNSSEYGFEVTKKPYGYRIVRVTHYVTVFTTRLEIASDGSAKAVTKVETNYQRPYRITDYFGTDGRQIIVTDENNMPNTRQELLEYKRQRDHANLLLSLRWRL